MDLHIGKTRFPEALWKCAWLYYHHCVEEVMSKELFEKLFATK
jgi:hypothetical protein